MSVEVEHTTEFALHEKAKLQKNLRRYDLVFFTVCALVSLDTMGTVAAQGPEGFTWMALLAVIFLLPYALVMAELGSTFTQEGGPYEWTKLAFGRLHACVMSVLYWVTNPLWVGGSLCFIATAAWSRNIHAIGGGSFGDYIFKAAFIWISIGVAIISLRHGKWIPNAGAIARVVLLGFFSFTIVIYAIKHGVHGATFGDLSPTKAVFFALVPVLIFNYVGFELQNGAAEEMQNPQRDVPISVIGSGTMSVLLYCVPVFGIFTVLPADKVTGIGGFIDAVSQTFTVYGSAAHALTWVATMGLIFTLLTSGAVWMIGSDRILAVTAYDGAFHPYFGVFSARLSTPVRVNTMSGIAATIFMVVAVGVFNGGEDAAFGVVLTIAISTTLISYLWIFPAAIKLRYSHGHVHRPYRLGASGNALMWVCGSIITFWVALGSWEAVFPGTLEPIFGVDYGSFFDAWGVSRLKYETLTLGTLGVVLVFSLVMYAMGAATRAKDVIVPLEAAQPSTAGD